VRITVPVGVSYKEDPLVVQKILVEVAKKNKGVMESPEPYVRFDEYADSSLNFSLLVWSRDFSDKPRILKSELYYAIFAEFKKQGVEIPFPQRDIHIIQPEAKEQ